MRHTDVSDSGPFSAVLRFGAVPVVLAVAFFPLLWMFWRDRAQRVAPLSVAFTAHNGEYRSPFFCPTKGDEYQIDLDNLPDRTPLNLRWRVVDEQGTELAAGKYVEAVGGGTTAILGHYDAKVQFAQRLVLNIQSMQDYPTTLHVEEPEETLSSSYALPVFGLWAALVLGTSLCVLLAFFVMRRVHRSDLTT